jgi:hypothetical protein
MRPDFGLPFHFIVAPKITQTSFTLPITVKTRVRLEIRYASPLSSQRVIEQCIQRVLDGFDIVSHFVSEQSLVDEGPDLCFAQLDGKAPEAITASLAVTAHAFGGGRASALVGRGVWVRNRRRRIDCAGCGSIEVKFNHVMTSSLIPND